MSEKLSVCKALAAMLRQHGEPDEEEVTFVGLAAMQLGLSPEDNQQVQTVLKEGGDFDGLLGEITSKPMRAFFLRRMLAATLLDEHINEQEQAFIDKTTSAFSLSSQKVADLVAWMKVSIEVEKQLTGLLAQI